MCMILLILSPEFAQFVHMWSNLAYHFTSVLFGTFKVMIPIENVITSLPLTEGLCGWNFVRLFQKM